jgi:hypothetical protein
MADTESDTPWEPPLAGNEVEHLTAALDRLRTTFRWKADGLDSAGLNVHIGVSALTLGNLLKHLARVEDYAFTRKMRGVPIGSPWDEIGWVESDDDEWEFTTAAHDTPSFFTGCGTAPSPAPASGWRRPWPRAASTSRSPSAGAASTPTCAASSAT